MIEIKPVDAGEFRVPHESIRHAWNAVWKSKEAEVYQVARDHGWWDDVRSGGEIISLIHSELSEALEAMREGWQRSEKIPNFFAVEEELADVVIRIMDYAHHINLNIADAITEKVEYNKTRPYKHGKEF